MPFRIYVSVRMHIIRQMYISYTIFIYAKNVHSMSLDGTFATA